MKRGRAIEEIQLPYGLLTLLEREAVRRNCTVSALIEHAVRSDLEDAEVFTAPREIEPKQR